MYNEEDGSNKDSDKGSDKDSEGSPERGSQGRNEFWVNIICDRLIDLSLQCRRNKCHSIPLRFFCLIAFERSSFFREGRLCYSGMYVFISIGSFNLLKGSRSLYVIFAQLCSLEKEFMNVQDHLRDIYKRLDLAPMEMAARTGVARTVCDRFMDGYPVRTGNLSHFINGLEQADRIGLIVLLLDCVKQDSASDEAFWSDFLEKLPSNERIALFRSFRLKTQKMAEKICA